MNPQPNDSIAYRDGEQLRLLSIFHYVLAGFAALFSLFPVIHLVFGIALLSGNIDRGDPNARVVGGFLTVIAVGCILFGVTLAACLAYAGRCLAQRKHYTFCVVVAAIACLFAPLGTVLGVFTLVVLMRGSVMAAFGRPVVGALRS